MDRFWLSAGTAMAIVAAYPAHAQEAAPPVETAGAGDSGSGSDIVVTARMRNETLMSAPLMVTAITAEQIARNPNSDLRNLTQMLPNVTATQTASGALGSFNIRGIGGANASDVGVDQAVTVVLDGVPISRGGAASGAYFDLGSIQVLPGPQALFFGKNASGGVIALATASPGANAEGYFKTGYEFVARQVYGEGAITVPISDTLRARLAFRAEDSDGWMRNTAGPRNNPFESNPLLVPQPGRADDRLGGTRTLAGRLTLVWKPTSDFTVTAKGQVSDTRMDNRAAFTEVVACSGGRTQSATFGITDPYSDCKANGVTSAGAMNPLLADNYVYAKDGRGYLDARTYFASLRVGYVQPQFSIVSTTGYYNTRVRGLGNDTYDSLVYFPGVNGTTDTQISEEFRVSSDFGGVFDFTGGFYLDRQTKGGYTIGRGLLFNYLPPINTSTLVPGQEDILPSAIGYWPQHRGRTDTASVFLEGTLRFTDRLTLDGGARFTAVDGSNVSRNRYVAPYYLSLTAGAATGEPCNAGGRNFLTSCLFVPPGTAVDRRFTEENVSPEATLSWKPTDEVMIYGAYKTGYKPGGISSPAVLLVSNLRTDLTFDSEKSKGFEVGVKADLFDGLMNLIVSGYRYQFDNLQVNQFDSATTSFFIRNAASAITKGFEVQTTVRPSRDLTLNATVNYNHGTFDNYRNAACYVGQTAALGCNIPDGIGGFLQDLSGAPLPVAPRWVALGGFSWTGDLGSDVRLRIDGDAKYSSSYSYILNNTPLGRQRAFAKVNTRISLLKNEDSWQLSFIGRNLTDRYIVMSANSKPGSGNAQDNFALILSGVVDRGRELAAELTFRF